ncbi:MAG: hypothetical protein JXB60_00025 [Candidatus Cloacimonetes bacterium]|nr:hypothetical protein [Candidatus Cloacimonadota bacterium]
MQYQYKKSLVDKEVTFMLENSILKVRSDEEELRIPLESIREIHLKFNRSRFKGREYRCIIKTDLNRKISFSNKFFSGIGNFYDQSDEYTDFLLILHQKMTEFNPDAVGRSGSKPGIYLLEILFSLFFLLVFGFLLIAALNLLGLLIIIFLSIPVIGYIIKNRPGKYKMSDIPYHLLPSRR